jgi:hypothetical protein
MFAFSSIVKVEWIPNMILQMYATPIIEGKKFTENL